MPAAAAKRSLPPRFNPLLQHPPPLQELVDMRRMGSTNLGEKTGSHGLFSYVHLRVALPQPLEGQELFGAGAPESYFLMRRSKDGFVSATGMFKASFPWAKKSEEEAEKAYVKQAFKKTSKEETAGNLWIPAADALALADEYGIKPWIEALLDNDPVSPPETRKRNITPPPPFFKESGYQSDASAASASSVPAPTASANTLRRSARSRSSSPTKRMVTPRKSRAAKARNYDSPLKKEVATISEETVNVTTAEKTETTSVTTNATVESVATAAPRLTNGTSSRPSSKHDPLKVEVDEAVETKGDVEVKTTHVKVELPPGTGEPPSPESTLDMIAKAREMVEKAKEVEGDSSIGSKRKADDIEGDEEEGTPETSAPPAKKNKVLEEALRREKIKGRALMGLVATLAVGTLLPYVL